MPYRAEGLRREGEGSLERKDKPLPPCERGSGFLFLPQSRAPATGSLDFRNNRNNNRIPSQYLAEETAQGRTNPIAEPLNIGTGSGLKVVKDKTFAVFKQVAELLLKHKPF